MMERQILMHRGVQCPALEVVRDLVAEEEVQHLLAKAPGESPVPCATWEIEETFIWELENLGSLHPGVYRETLPKSWKTSGWVSQWTTPTWTESLDLSLEHFHHTTVAPESSSRPEQYLRLSWLPSIPVGSVSALGLLLCALNTISPKRGWFGETRRIQVIAP